MSQTTRTLLLVTPYFPPQGGGLERYAKHITDRLVDYYNWRVVVVCAGEHRGTDTTETIGSLTVHRLGFRFKLSNTPFDLGWRRKLKAIIRDEKPDLINAHMPVPGLADVAASAAGRIPFVVTYHAGTMKKGKRLIDLLVGTYETFGLRFVLGRADRILCSSDFVRDEFLGRWKSKSVTVTPGVDEALFKPVAKTQAGHKTLLFVGNYGPSYRHKGLNDLIETLPALTAKFPGLTVNIVGVGDQDDVRATAATLGVESGLKFLGLQDSQALAQLYPQADVVVLPSHNDSFPMVLVEAMACGTPVVSTTVGGIPTLVENGVTGLLVTPGDTTALGSAIERILSDKVLAKQMGETGRELVEKELTWSSKTRATSEIFEAAMRPAVGQVTAYYPPHVGGVETVVKELSEALMASGHRVEVFTAAGHGHTNDTSGLTVHRLRGFEALNTPVMPLLLPALLRLPKRSVIHVHVAQAFVPEVAWLAAAIRRQPLISHVHLDVDPSSTLGRIFFGTYKKLILGFVLSHSTRVICLSEDQRELMTKRYRLDPSRVLVLPNGVSADYFRAARTRTHTPLRLLFVGRLALQKRPERIVEAMAQLPGAHLDVVGDGDHRASLETYVREHQLTNVTFHGVRQGTELKRFYENADALIMTSDKEGMPLVLLEAMAMSLPIIGSDVLGIRELIRGVGILVADPSAATFAKAIKHFSDHPSKLAPLSAASHEAAQAYSWDVLSSRVAELYREVRA
ncbi:MAG TPA: glycosyltransferase family 4 protein [Candidatus Saccharimonadia bacterium]|jgi:glycosyltransferase involved in cell wall biosynthesis|nr:glycosyltransferase family 4 protein [Candidatus Saccharimonadia bacterium]